MVFFVVGLFRAEVMTLRQFMIKTVACLSIPLILTVDLYLDTAYLTLLVSLEILLGTSEFHQDFLYL
jgi:hypothetical protein